MKIKVLEILVLGFILALLISVGASCGDDDDDGDDDNDADDADDDNEEPTGVCHYECTYFTNTTIRQTTCYDTGGGGSMAHVVRNTPKSAVTRSRKATRILQTCISRWIVPIATTWPANRNGWVITPDKPVRCLMTR